MAIMKIDGNNEKWKFLDMKTLISSSQSLTHASDACREFGHCATKYLDSGHN